MSNNLRNLVSKDILHQIRNGDIKSNSIFTEAMICESMNLSRTPVREALIELTANNILERVPRKGYKLKELNFKSKNDSYVVLANLDALAATLALPNLTKDDFLRMNEICDLIDISIKYENYPQYCDRQEEFHHVYIDKCDNQLLIDTLDNVKTSVTRYLYYSIDTPKLFEILAAVNLEHREIISFFENDKPEELAEYLINTHWLTRYPDLI